MLQKTSIFETYYTHIMKHLIPIISSVVCLFIMSCNTETSHIVLLEADTYLEKEKNDSAYLLLSSIDEEKISSRDDMMLFLLLRERTNFLTDRKTDTKSLQECIDYYKNHDDIRLMQAYFYKGVADAELKRDVRDILENLKKAERIAMKYSDSVMLNKIYDNLASVNMRQGEYAIALHYTKLNKEISEGMRNDYWKSYVYNFMAVCYNMLQQRDSSVYYMKKSVDLINVIPLKYQPQIIANYIALCSVNADNALKLSKEMYSKYPSPENACYIAAQLDKIGKSEEADKYWSIALTQDVIVNKIEMLRYMIQTKGEIGDYKSAYKKTNELINLVKEINSKRENDKILELQIEFDKRQNEQEIIQTLAWIVALIIIVILLIVVITFYGRMRYLKVRNEIADKQQQILYLQELVEKNSLQEHPDMEKLDEARAMLEELRQDTLIKEGKLLYQKIQEGETTVTWKKKHYLCFLAYFWTTNPELCMETKKRYTHLTPRQEFYIAIQHLLHNDNEVQRIMASNEGAIKTMQTRIRKQVTV